VALRNSPFLQSVAGTATSLSIDHNRHRVPQMLVTWYLFPPLVSNCRMGKRHACTELLTFAIQTTFWGGKLGNRRRGITMSLFLLFCVFSCLLGFLTVALYISWCQARQLLGTQKGSPQWLHTACPKASATARPQLQGKYDRRLTGAGNIDEQLQKAVTYGLRDYVQLWYHRYVSPEPEFVHKTRQTLDQVIREIACRYLTHLYSLLSLSLSPLLVEGARKLTF